MIETFIENQKIFQKDISISNVKETTDFIKCFLLLNYMLNSNQILLKP